jgi:hypothetical protein
LARKYANCPAGRVIEQRSSAGTYLQYSPMLKFLWRRADLVVNYELVVAKPSEEPFWQTIRFTIRQLW